MRPSAALKIHADAIVSAVARHKAGNPRVFGSVLRGVDGEASDLDLLVDASAGATLLDLGALQVELEQLLGIRVDVVTEGDLPSTIRQRIITEARPL